MTRALISAALISALALPLTAFAHPHGGSHANPFGKVRHFEWSRGASPRGFLGVQIQSMTPELRRYFGAPEGQGVLVASVEKDGPAAEAGIEVGDIILSVDGEPIRNFGDLVGSIYKAGGEQVSVEIVRDRAPRTLQATIEERPGFNAGAFQKRFSKMFEDLSEDMPNLLQRLERLEERLERLEKDR